MLQRVLFIFVVLALGACGNSDNVRVASPAGTPEYFLPATPGARLCADQCTKSKDYCVDSCNLDHRACYNEVQLEAVKAYDEYARDRFSYHAPAALFPSDFEHPQRCNDTKKNCLNDCQKPYDDCYRKCGGTITKTSSCQYLCFD